MATKHHAGRSTEEAAGSLEGHSLTQSDSGDSSFRSIPSRKELLEIIRKHSSILGQAPPSGGEEEPVDPWFWREILDMFFVRGFADKKTPQDDDLLYFVRITDNDLVIVSERDEQAGEPYFVRRFAPNLDKVIGTSAWEVDWCRSVYLNLIQHTAYSLTVAICNREVLQSHHRASGAPLTPMYKVTKTVYASPTRTNFQSDNSKAIETQSSYPDICFSVDDFANTFEAVVLSDSDQCLCVLLDACGGAALAREEEDTIRTGLEMRLPDEEAPGPRASKVTLFSGFVSYSMVRSAFENGRTKFGGLHLGGSSSRPERLIMRGPGGRGEVDVAVSSVPADDDIRNQGSPAPPSPTKPGVKPGLGTIVWKAALAASTAARNAVIASSNGGKHDLGSPVPLRCCLMSLSLPWNSLGHDLLYK